MKKIFCITLILFFSSGIFSQTKEPLPSSVLGIPFGSTIKEVKKEMRKKGGNAIYSKINRGKDYLILYSCSSLYIAGHKCSMVTYSFFDKKLYSGEISFHLTDVTQDMGLEKYEKIESGLVSKYGNPIEGEVINSAWEKSKLDKLSTWSSNNTIIQMRGSSGSIEYGVYWLELEYIDSQLYKQLENSKNSDF